MHFEGICGLKTELNYPFKLDFPVNAIPDKERNGRGSLFSFLKPAYFDS